MADFLLREDKQLADVSLVNGNFEQTESIETSVMVSLFSDARITPEELPDGITDLSGYWADEFSDIPNDLHGSKLWLLSTAKPTESNASLAEQYASDSLRWMRTIGLASEIEVRASFIQPEGELDLQIRIERPNGSSDLFAVNWKAQELKRVI